MKANVKRSGVSSTMAAFVLLAASAAVVWGGQPNILFIAVDDLRPQLGCYGEPEAITPNIDRLAQEGTRFNRAYVCHPLCSPSRAGLLTGRRVAPGYLPAAEKSRDSESSTLHDTFPRTLHNAGYYTATHGKFYHGGAGQLDPGVWDVDTASSREGEKDWTPEVAARIAASGGRKDHMEHFLSTGKGGGDLVWVSVDGPDNILNDGNVAEKTIEQLRIRPKGKPFFIAAGFVGPHLPWVAPKKYFDLYPANAGTMAPIPAGKERVLRSSDATRGVGANALWNEGVTDEEAQKLIRGYMASTTYTDAQIGRLIAELHAQGLEENTIVILWGDSGYHLTDHGLWRKNSPYHVALRCPLIVRVPGMAPGQVVERVVETVDVYPTLLELAGIPIPEKVKVDGKSLVPLLKDPNAAIGGEAFTAAPRVFGMVTDGYRFTMSRRGRKYELYDLKNDPHEWNNLADDPAQQERIREFGAKVRKAWGLDTRSNQPSPPNEGLGDAQDAARGVGAPDSHGSADGRGR